MKAIMYHYVRPYNSSYPNFKNLHIDDFSKQLDYFEEKYGFVNKDEFISYFDSNNSESILPKGVILTFDDGLSCHYDFVFAELKRRNLWGIFYVPAMPYLDNKMLDVHRTHLLLGKIDSKEVYEFMISIVNDSMLDNLKEKEFKEFTYKSQNNDNYTLSVKRYLNYFIDYEYRTDVLNALMERFIPDEQEIKKSFYLSSEQMLEMHNNGMVIGSHSINHSVMSRLSKEIQYKEISESFSFLEQVINPLPFKTFCYPYGGFHSFNNETEQLLDDINCKFSFNVEPRDIETNDMLNRPQALPRYDCNDFKYGTVRGM